MRRSMSVMASLVLAAGLIASACATRLTTASPSATASSSAAAMCEVTNAGTGTTYRTLQKAVDGSEEGDTLEVRGTCIGVTLIRATQLRLKGIATTEQPTPTLDGARLSRVLRIHGAKVVIRDLTITNGKENHGGGIETSHDWGADPGHPRVTLSGDTSVTGNSGGGIYNFNSGTVTLNDSASVSGNRAGGGGGIRNDGTLTLNDTASVTGNRARYGGGINNLSGTVTLNDSASVTGNSAKDGGGIYNFNGDLTLNDSASVMGNTAGTEGGGIYNEYGTLTLNDSASVTGNTAEDEGGGIYNAQTDYGHSRVYVCSEQVAISPNDPDDPPKVRHACP